MAPTPLKVNASAFDSSLTLENALFPSPPGMERMVLRTDRHRREVAHKMKHPYKLHPQLWYNEKNELNDGPACACKKRHQTGPLHNIYEGEEVSSGCPTVVPTLSLVCILLFDFSLQKIPSCDPTSNNLDKLYHYRMYVLPTVNFSSRNPTVIVHNGQSYRFDGYSIFSHHKLESVSQSVLQANY